MCVCVCLSWLRAVRCYWERWAMWMYVCVSAHVCVYYVCVYLYIHICHIWVDMYLVLPSCHLCPVYVNALMSVCMCVWIYVFIYIYIYNLRVCVICIHIHIYVYIYINTCNIRAFAGPSKLLFVIHTCMHECMHIKYMLSQSLVSCIHTYTYVCVYIYIYIHIHISYVPCVLYTYIYLYVYICTYIYIQHTSFRRPFHAAHSVWIWSNQHQKMNWVWVSRSQPGELSLSLKKLTRWTDSKSQEVNQVDWVWVAKAVVLCLVKWVDE
jgi:hypothetical protein